MGILAFLILGLLCGVIAKFLLPGRDPGGLLVTLVIGVIGALVGGFLATALLKSDPMDGFWDASSWLTAIAGSVLVLLVWRAVRGRRGRR
ncbi:GlsB/YeaQ/YmgE family stress response membrane protein [Actinopolymorpha sp. B17G11]|uniref:GlsB/YeaQ/YmgE family stress response membrane protein n=1 Tax=Actinopolymorpha sp. B17G11 TaxID=3160861 RepID=UPI0032E50C56